MFPKLSLKQLIGILVAAAVLFACLPGALSGVPVFVLVIAAVASIIPIMFIHGVIYAVASIFAERKPAPPLANSGPPPMPVTPEETREIQREMEQ